jgi:hypothetical protein
VHLSTTASTDEELKKAISLLPHLVEQFYRIIEHRIDGDFDEDLQRMQD